MSMEVACALAGILMRDMYRVPQVLFVHACFGNYLHFVTRSELNHAYSVADSLRQYLGIAALDTLCSYRRASLAANCVTHQGW